MAEKKTGQFGGTSVDKPDKTEEHGIAYVRIAKEVNMAKDADSMYSDAPYCDTETPPGWDNKKPTKLKKGDLKNAG